MTQIKPYGKRILTLTAESELITHKEQFRDSRRGNQTLISRMKWLKRLNEYVNKPLFEIGCRRGMAINKLKVTITKN